MLSDIRLERGRHSQEFSFDVVRQRVQAVMETLSSQKRQFEKCYQRKIERYEKQINIKDAIIEELKEKLKASDSMCQKLSEQTDHYKAIINDFKKQFNRLTAIFNLSFPSQEKKQLKRVKSDYLTAKQLKKHMNNEIQSIKIKRFDINSYFSDLKANAEELLQTYQINQPKKETFDDKKSNTSKTVKMKFIFSQSVNDFESDKKTVSKWIQKSPWHSKEKKQNYVKIKDYKQNLWQGTV